MVDDGSTDASGALADALRRPRPAGAGRAHRQPGPRRGPQRGPAPRHAATCSPSPTPTTSCRRRAYAVLLRAAARTGCDLVTGSIAWWYDAGDAAQPVATSSRRGCAACTRPRPRRLRSTSMPEMLGDVFAWNKLFRRDFWDASGLSWPEGIRYEDQPTLTRAYLQARRIGVVPDVVYHWRIRNDGSSITQQRGVVRRPRGPVGDQADVAATRCATTARTACSRSSTTGCSPATCTATSCRSPTADDEWYRLLESGVRELLGRGRWCTPACRRCTGSPAGWSSRAAATTPPP